MTKEQQACRHDMFSRVQDSKALVDMNGHGALVPFLQCDLCGAFVYLLKPTPKAES